MVNLDHNFFVFFGSSSFFSSVNHFHFKMFNKSIALMAAAAQQQFVSAHKVYRECQQPVVEQHFDVTGYTGLWYEQVRDKEVIYETGICNTANYTFRPDGDIRVRNNELALDTEEWGGGTGKAYLADKSKNEGHLKVKFVPFIPAGDYKVLETDYENFSIVHGCESMPGQDFNTEYVWILTRDVYPSNHIMQHAYNVIANKVPLYDMSLLVPTPQGHGALPSGADCPYDSAPYGEEMGEGKTFGKPKTAEVAKEEVKPSYNSGYG